MSTLRPPEPAKLVVGSFMRHRSGFPRLFEMLAAAFGTPDVISAWWPFDKTDYYHGEMGGPLYRRMMSFRELIDPADLPDVKHRCMEVEDTLAEKGGRTVNLDPGYLVASRFVLATGKNFSHRIYLGRSIYADLTLLYDVDRFRPLPWTYPDYRQPEMTRYLARVRSKYMADTVRASGVSVVPGIERSHP